MQSESDEMVLLEGTHGMEAEGLLQDCVEVCVASRTQRTPQGSKLLMDLWISAKQNFRLEDDDFCPNPS